MNTISEQIKFYRAKTGLSLEKVAEKLGVTYQTVQQWEKGETMPRANRLQKIAEVLNTDTSSLVSETTASNRVVTSMQDWPFKNVSQDDLKQLPPEVLEDVEDYIQMKLNKLLEGKRKSAA